MKNDSIFAVTLVAFLVEIVSTHFHYFPFHFHYIRFDGSVALLCHPHVSHLKQMYSHLWDCKLSHSFPIFILITFKRTVVVLPEPTREKSVQTGRSSEFVWVIFAQSWTWELFHPLEGHCRSISKEGSSNKLIVKFVDMISTQWQHSARPFTSIPNPQIFCLQKANNSLWVFAMTNWALFQCQSSGRLGNSKCAIETRKSCSIDELYDRSLPIFTPKEHKNLYFHFLKRSKSHKRDPCRWLVGIVSSCIDNCKLVASSVNIPNPVQRWKFREESKHAT